MIPTYEDNVDHHGHYRCFNRFKAQLSHATLTYSNNVSNTTRSFPWKDVKKCDIKR